MPASSKKGRSTSSSSGSLDSIGHLQIEVAWLARGLTKEERLGAGRQHGFVNVLLQATQHELGRDCLERARLFQTPGTLCARGTLGVGRGNGTFKIAAKTGQIPQNAGPHKIGEIEKLAQVILIMRKKRDSGE